MTKTLIIRYVSWASHNFIGKSQRWEASFEGETDVHDWNTKQHHIDEAERNGWNYKVLRMHKDGTTSVVQSRMFANASPH
jgi:hypothetical protein